MDHCCNCKNQYENRELVNWDDCVDCKGLLCDKCVSHCWHFQLVNDGNNVHNVVRLRGCMIVFDERGIGKKYCMKCYENTINTVNIKQQL